MHSSHFIIENIARGQWNHPILWSHVIGVAVIAIVVAVIIDMISALKLAKKIGEDIESSKLRHSISKIRDYLFVLFLTIFLDSFLSAFSFWDLPWISMLVAIACMAIEGKSLIEKQKMAQSRAGDIPEKALTLLKGLKNIPETQRIYEAIEGVINSDKNKE